MTNIEDFRMYCLTLKGVTESFPFDQDTLVFKVMNKMFALTSLKGSFEINLKCQPEKAMELRETYSFVKPGYHMNKQHWNTIQVDVGLDPLLLKEWIDDSYLLVVSKLTKKEKQVLAQM